MIAFDLIKDIGAEIVMSLNGYVHFRFTHPVFSDACIDLASDGTYIIRVFCGENQCIRVSNSRNYRDDFRKITGL